MNKTENVMGKQAILICFVLDSVQNSANREEDIYLVRKEFQKEGIPFAIFDAFPAEGGGFTFRAAEGSDLGMRGEIRNSQLVRAMEKGWSPDIGEILWTADSDRLLEVLQTKNCPAAAYRHRGNESQKFDRTGWIVEEPQYVDVDSYEKIWQRLTGNPWVITGTEHLLIREMTEEDVDALYDLYDDPAVKQFLPPLASDRQQERSILRAYIRKVYGLYGYGMWAVCDRRTGELIGRAGFEPYHGRSRAVELGYVIRADRRRRGLAAEAVRAVLQFADEYLDFPAVAIRTNAENRASIHLALSLGFVETLPQAISVDAEKNGVIRYFIREKPAG